MALATITERDLHVVLILRILALQDCSRESDFDHDEVQHYSLSSSYRTPILPLEVLNTRLSHPSSAFYVARQHAILLDFPDSRRFAWLDQDCVAIKCACVKARKTMLAKLR